MKKYNVKVNGVAYEVEVEEVQAFSAPVPATQKIAPPATAPAAAPTPAAPAPVESKPASSNAAGSFKIEAPMNGTVTKVLVKPGDSIKTGDTVLTFEAMKMEQEIKSPKDGVVASVHIQQGTAINQGDLLVSLN